MHLISPTLVICPLTSATGSPFHLFLYDNYYFNSSDPIDIRICQFGLVEFLMWYLNHELKIIIAAPEQF